MPIISLDPQHSPLREIQFLVHLRLHDLSKATYNKNKVAISTLVSDPQALFTLLFAMKLYSLHSYNTPHQPLGLLVQRKIKVMVAKSAQVSPGRLSFEMKSSAQWVQLSDRLTSSIIRMDPWQSALRTKKDTSL